MKPTVRIELMTFRLGCFQHIPDADSHHRYGHASAHRFQQIPDVDPHNLSFPPILLLAHAILSSLLPHLHMSGR
jgi:hypothetical protein